MTVRRLVRCPIVRHPQAPFATDPRWPAHDARVPGSAGRYTIARPRACGRPTSRLLAGRLPKVVYPYRKLPRPRGCGVTVTEHPWPAACANTRAVRSRRFVKEASGSQTRPASSWHRVSFHGHRSCRTPGLSDAQLVGSHICRTSRLIGRPACRMSRYRTSAGGTQLVDGSLLRIRRS